MKKLEAELWNLKVIGTDVVKYNQRFQELALLCVRMFPEESDKIERYVGGLPDMIHGNIMASRPKTMQEAIEMATELMDKRVSTIAERQAENKRKFENTSRNNQNQQQQNKRQNTGQAYTAGNSDRKSYAGSKPLIVEANLQMLTTTTATTTTIISRAMVALSAELKASGARDTSKRNVQEEDTTKATTWTTSLRKYRKGVFDLSGNVATKEIEDSPEMKRIRGPLRVGVSFEDRLRSVSPIKGSGKKSFRKLPSESLWSYEFQVMRLVDNAPAVFMDSERNKQEHKEHLKIILELLKKEELYAKFSKCEFWIPKVQFPRHHQRSSILRFAGYYRMFSRGFSRSPNLMTKAQPEEG
ncbi:hypothetical protein Tco_1057172 [Tanacetum coccineum]|uniref:Reverse transcriptase domain-containing protein n=1 Tax=Tanacetum coccineum TaxID=301880 RepID=A0ABQ5H640_9ASTR